MSTDQIVPERVSVRPSPPRFRRRRWRTSGLALLLILPSLLGIGAFLIAPSVAGIVISFEHWNIISAPSWVGWANYRSLLTDPIIWHSIGVTVRYVLLVIPLQTVLGLAMALLLSRRLPGSAVFRIVFAIPWICAPLALGVVWKWIFAPTGGALNALIGQRVEWLSDMHLALPAVALVAIWSQVGYVTLFYLAGLSGVPSELQDAARVDGAGEFSVFWRITLPLLRPTTSFVLATTTISAFQVFDTVYAMTAGGPGSPGQTDVVAQRIFDLAFNQLDMGRAAALSIILMLALVTATVVQQLYFQRRITYDVVG